MKINILNLEFTNDHYYVQNKSIVEKIIFNNRTFYSKFEHIQTPLTPLLVQKHLNNEITLAIALIEEIFVNYIVIEYQQNDWNSFYSLIKHLLKSFNIENFQAYRDNQKELLQIFIPREKIDIQEAYIQVENIKHLLELKSKKSYKIYPNKHLPKNLNIITLPIQKI